MLISKYGTQYISRKLIEKTRYNAQRATLASVSATCYNVFAVHNLVAVLVAVNVVVNSVNVTVTYAQSAM